MSVVLHRAIVRECQRRTIYGVGTYIDQPLIVMDYAGGSATSYTYHSDARFSVVAMTDSSGTVIETYSYDAYGVASINTPTTGQPYRYTGRRYDEETGLYYYRARYYHTKMGRFLQADPIGYQGRLNLYAYVNNDPRDRDLGCEIYFDRVAMRTGGAGQGLVKHLI